jgi:hypothetical protein
MECKRDLYPETFGKAAGLLDHLCPDGALP